MKWWKKDFYSQWVKWWKKDFNSHWVKCWKRFLLPMSELVKEIASVVNERTGERLAYRYKWTGEILP